MEKKETVITAIGDNGEAQIIHCSEVGLKGAATKDEWIEAMAAAGFAGHGKSWDFSEEDFAE